MTGVPLSHASQKFPWPGRGRTVGRAHGPCRPLQTGWEPGGLTPTAARRRRGTHGGEM